MVYNMVKEQGLIMMDRSMLGNGEMELDGTEHHTTKTEKFTKSMRMGNGLNNNPPLKQTNKL